MNLSKKICKAGAVLGFSLAAASANAAFINGSISFSDGFDPIPTVVSDTAFFDVNATNTTYTGGTGDFGALVFGSVLAAGDIAVGAPGGVLYDVPGFTFTVLAQLADTASALDCLGGLCTDSRQLTLSGSVSGAGFDDTAWVGNFTANGSCAGAAGACTSLDTYTATWSSSLTALGIDAPPPVPMPAPGALALFAIGMLGFGARRRRTA